MRLDRDSILKDVIEHYLGSGDFNGTPVRELEGSSTATRELIVSLVRDEVVSLNFGDRHPNPAVQALAPDTIEEQLRKLAGSGDLSHVYMYPTPARLHEAVDREEYRDRPYSLRLALGEHLFVFVPFDLRVLEHYRNDPRYHYLTDHIQGSIGVRDKFYQSGQMREADEVLVKHFGFGYDGQMSRCVMMMLCDLAVLTPEHQQVWRGQELKGDFRPHPTLIGSVYGHWPEKQSIFTAFLEELNVINRMSAAMGRPGLFRDDFAHERPRRFGFLIRPTLAELNDSVLLLDKMLSDNIDAAFFQGDVALEFEETRKDGSTVVRPKGTLRALQDWLASNVNFPDPGPKDKMLATFKRIRQLRQRPAHAVHDDAFDHKYSREQRQLVIDAYQAIRTLRLILSNHPVAGECKVPEWLRDGAIWTY